jgi:uncharacterized DUF497 family protein
VKFTWWALKCASNVRHHGLDFADAERVFDGPTFTFEDDRFDYGERRFNTLGLLDGVPVSVIHTETDDEIRIISFRKATRSETALLFRIFQH